MHRRHRAKSLGRAPRPSRGVTWSSTVGAYKRPAERTLPQTQTAHPSPIAALTLSSNERVPPASSITVPISMLRLHRIAVLERLASSRTSFSTKRIGHRCHAPAVRLMAVQRCPELLVRPKRRQDVAASSRSASSITISGIIAAEFEDLALVDRLRAAIYLPISTPPVKVTRSTPVVRQELIRDFAGVAGDDAEHLWRQPRLVEQVREQQRATAGVFSEGLSTMRLLVARCSVRHLVRHLIQRMVKWRDRSNHAEQRLAQGVHLAPLVRGP